MTGVKSPPHSVSCGSEGYQAQEAEEKGSLTAWPYLWASAWHGVRTEWLSPSGTCSGAEKCMANSILESVRLDTQALAWAGSGRVTGTQGPEAENIKAQVGMCDSDLEPQMDSTQRPGTQLPKVTQGQHHRATQTPMTPTAASISAHINTQGHKHRHRTPGCMWTELYTQLHACTHAHTPCPTQPSSTFPGGPRQLRFLAWA